MAVYYQNLQMSKRRLQKETAKGDCRTRLRKETAEQKTAKQETAKQETAKQKTTKQTAK